MQNLTFCEKLTSRTWLAYASPCCCRYRSEWLLDCICALHATAQFPASLPALSYWHGLHACAGCCGVQTGMPSSTSDMAGKVWCVSAETPSSAASASKKTKSVPVATSTEAAKWLSLHWQHRVFSEAWLSVLRLPMSQVRLILL